MRTKMHIHKNSIYIHISIAVARPPPGNHSRMILPFLHCICHILDTGKDITSLYIFTSLAVVN